MSSAHTSAQGQGIAWIVGVGPTGGLGAALARRFAAAGLLTVVSGRTPERLHALVHEIESSGGRALAAAGDVTEPAFIGATLDRIRGLGRLQAAIFNAGGNRWQPTLEMTDAFFEEVWRLCCFAGFVFGRDCARELLASGGGSLLFTGASASLRGRPQFTAFAAAKAGLRMVSQSLARELGPQGLHVAHVIIDGLIDGERAREVAQSAVERRGADGLLRPEAIAETFYQLHQQPRSAWTHEIDLRPFNEPF
jgi:NAD(P)-dependent dehydrogenase (short-subunit alcohol dehydrogenase family)